MAIDIIANLGDDALQNLFEMSIGPGIPGLADLESTLLRIQNLTIPATGVETYEVHYKTQKFEKPGGKIDAPNEFTFDFRVDRFFAIYKGFVAWKNVVANSRTGVISPDIWRVPITVWAIDSNGSPLPNLGQWTFEGCFVKQLGDVPFDYTSGDPITVTVTMSFMAMDDNAL